MLGTFTELAPIVRCAIEQKQFCRTSAEIYEDWTRTRSERDLNTGCTGPTLAAVAILGSTIPVVKTLADLDTYLHSEDGAERTVWADEAEGRVQHATGESPQLSDAPSRSVTAAERIARCERVLAEIRTRNTAAQLYFSAGSFDAESAPEDVGGLGQTFCDTVDGELLRQNLPHDDEAARRRVAVAVLKSWTEKDNPYGAGTLGDALDSADFERAATGYAKNATNGGVLAHAEGALPSVDAGGGIEAQFRISLEQAMAQRGWPAEDVQKRKEAARIVLDEYQRLPADLRYGDGDNLASQVTDAIYSTVIYGTATAAGRPTFDSKERGVTQATESTRGFAQCTEATPKRANAPLYGNRARIADEVGGPANLARLHQIAAANGLRLGRKADHKAALALLCKETGEDLLRMGEETLTPPSYGSRGRAVPTPSAREIAFTENANARLRAIPMDVPDRISRAYKAEAAANPALCPDYGFNTRQRRARG